MSFERNRGTRVTQQDVMPSVPKSLYPQWGRVEAVREFSWAIRPDA
jgi:hypothetical protein